MKIQNIHALEILDSRGNPTVMTFVTLDDGTQGYASVPSGASTGSHEALELRDNDPKRYLGKGVLGAVAKVNTTIASALSGKSIEDLMSLDTAMRELDGTENKSNLGANAILSVSLAAARALANFQKKPLWKVLNEYYFSHKKPDFPRLMVNIINGGAHANWIFDIQEFMIIPKQTNPAESVRIASEIFHHLGEILKKNGFNTLVGDEGGYAPPLTSNEEAFEYIHKAIAAAGYTVGSDVDLGIDAAASEFYTDQKYSLKKSGKTLSSPELMSLYETWITKYGIYTLEDPYSEDDWDSFKSL